MADTNVKKELEEKLEKMIEDKKAKLESAHSQLVDMLSVTAEKYRTATGTLEALRVMKSIDNSTGFSWDPSWANIVAHDMSDIALAMAEKARSLEPENMSELCEGFYEDDFDLSEVFDFSLQCDRLVHELMILDLCRNAGGAAEDMVQFAIRADEEIDATRQALEDTEDEE